MLHRAHKAALRRSPVARQPDHPGAAQQRKPLRPSLISQACGNEQATRDCRSGFALDAPAALRKATLVRY